VRRQAAARPKVEPFEDGYITKIQEDNQVDFQHLSVGIKNFQKEACVDNPRKKCLSAALWAVDFKERGPGSPVRVHKPAR
jgi:hypothetical protein